METTAVDATRSRGRFHFDPAVTAAMAGWLLAFGGAFLWRLVYGLGMEVTDWRLLGCVGINVITSVLLWSERRRVLAHAPREAGADEASWGEAAADCAMRRRLAHPVSLVLLAIFVVLVPWTVWLWSRFVWMIVAFFPFGHPEIDQLLGSGSGGKLLWMLWWPVILGLLGTGVFFQTGQVRPPALGAGAASERLPGSRRDDDLREDRASSHC